MANAEQLLSGMIRARLLVYQPDTHPNQKELLKSYEH